MKKFSLNAEQKILVEKNLDIVKFAIHKSIIFNDNLYGFAYDDLYQEGCIWLCKAAFSYNEARDVKFTTYAEKVVVNGLRTYCRLMYGKQKHYVSLLARNETDNIIYAVKQVASEDLLNRLLEEQDIFQLLHSCKQQYTGTARLGIEASTASSLILSEHGFPGLPKNFDKMKALCSISEGLLKMTVPKS